MIHWVLSKSGIKHLFKGKVYRCNQALLHTGNFVPKYSRFPICAKCVRLVRTV